MIMLVRLLVINEATNLFDTVDMVAGRVQCTTQQHIGLHQTPAALHSVCIC